MPFPWKKVTNTKISQLVSDHLESQRRRRGHLVVETGFPTSLVDLFVKNRDRLKKPKSSKKKKKTKDIDNPSSLPSSSSFPSFRGINPSPFTSPSISRTPSLLSLASTTSFSSLPPPANNGVQEADGVDKEMNERPNVEGVIGAIVRMCFVVVLALGSKKFAVGLTMSAFFLFLIEYVAKYSCRLLVPCSEAKRRLGLKLQGILHFIDKSLHEDKTGVLGIKGPRVEASSESNNHGDASSICEIQIARPVFVGNIHCVRKEIGESSSGIRREVQIEKEIGKPSCDGNGNGTSQFERSDLKTMINLEKEVEYGCDTFDSKKEESKKARMKSKIKRLVTRKLRGSKKEKQDFEEGETNPSKEKIVAKLEEPEDNQEGDARSLESDSKVSSLLSGKLEGNDEMDTHSNSGVVCEENIEESVMKEEKEKPRKGDSGYLILCLIVLIGLVGGRIIAFMLMVLWFLMLKSGERLRRDT
ncbi:hypothetical protein M9H77_00709 [Catharanthus roseus]|uniref:Uncharacterized protein n=1 Tax=Catharanthus roseus TaxID=4058 RepID=A0ACC0C3R5_CATRO|nr:hypothetical protein M9H77_00709 [Catharanthus roseus]